MIVKENNEIQNKFSFQKFIISFWKSLFWAATISVLSLMSGSSVSKVYFLNFRQSDKLSHFVMYFIFSYFLYEGFTKFLDDKYPRKKKILIVLIISVFLGSLMEILQVTIVVNREAEVLDFIANTLGSLFALWFYKFFNKIWLSIIEKIF